MKDNILNRLFAKYLGPNRFKGEIHCQSSQFLQTSSSSGESLDEFHRNILQGGEVLGY